MTNMGKKKKTLENMKLNTPEDYESRYVETNLAIFSQLYLME